LIPVTGFYEWMKLEDGSKQPVRIHPAEENGLWALAGIYEYWMNEDGSELQSCTLLTREPNELIAPIHRRMPVILSPEDFDTWMDELTPIPVVQSLFSEPYPAEKIHIYPVSTHVNSARNDDPICINPLHKE